jgi:hypothetical protein
MKRLATESIQEYNTTIATEGLHSHSPLQWLPATSKIQHILTSQQKTNILLKRLLWYLRPFRSCSTVLVRVLLAKNLSSVAKPN